MPMSILPRRHRSNASRLRCSGLFLRPHKNLPRALQAFDRTMRHGPKIFSWFIYRVTTPTLRDLFMGPGDPRLQEAVLSVLAGDIFRGTPLGLRLFAFKTVYYLRNLFNPRRTLSAWKKRKQTLREPNAATTAS